MHLPSGQSGPLKVALFWTVSQLVDDLRPIAQAAIPGDQPEIAPPFQSQSLRVRPWGYATSMYANPFEPRIRDCAQTNHLKECDKGLGP